MIVSSIKGRVRIVDENIKQLEIVTTIKQKIENLDGITNVRITEAIGSLLINYDEDKIKLEKITDELKDLVSVEKDTEQIIEFKEGIKLDKKNIFSMIAKAVRGGGIAKTATVGFLGVQGCRKGRHMFK